MAALEETEGLEVWQATVRTAQTDLTAAPSKGMAEVDRTAALEEMAALEESEDLGDRAAAVARAEPMDRQVLPPMAAAAERVETVARATTPRPMATVAAAATEAPAAWVVWEEWAVWVRIRPMAALEETAVLEAWQATVRTAQTDWMAAPSKGMAGVDRTVAPEVMAATEDLEEPVDWDPAAARTERLDQLDWPPMAAAAEPAEPEARATTPRPMATEAAAATEEMGELAALAETQALVRIRPMAALEVTAEMPGFPATVPMAWMAMQALPLAWRVAMGETPALPESVE
jgi:hypothetical protein